MPCGNNWILLFGILAAQGIYILAMYVPMTQSVLHVTPVSLEEWGTLLFLASTILITVEIFKVVKRRSV
ncbi:cation transporting ATPase C-terminal domain-containing protein [Candidatus Nitronereus thalassa]|uniref:Cation transporting ATPase C-terminal domain-containing protein n=1 Tax=Candidatus Nitronereus thalassa TaxID=3020898 RepID=A0ABU3K940_9BACT|nr:cation transporting ATPase C-terminal domain-containing protein [Candidatus Nitronereus thalassa]MDT7042879.1 cation transporting ATPase C-terminal domain-containing protein [Candidatus Nitronereus thalassa]